jgi:hypothetical protein
MKKVTQTISDADWAKIQARAEKAAPPMFSREAVRRREMSHQQKRKASQN